MPEEQKQMVGTCAVTTAHDEKAMSISFSVPLGDDIALRNAVAFWLEIYEENIIKNYGPLVAQMTKDVH